MATTKVIPLYSADDISRTGKYLADSKHKNHQTHTIEGPISCGADTLEQFVSHVRLGISILNRERRDRNQISIAAYWIIWRFEDHSDLAAHERETFQLEALRHFANGAPVYGYWHRDWLLETADFNLIIPAFDGLNLPVLRKFSDRSLYSDCRHFADQQTFAINAKRTAEGMPPLRDAADAHVDSLLTRRWETVERKVAKQSAAMKVAVTPATIPTILTSLGYIEDEDWSIEDGVSLRFCRRTKKRRKWFRIRLADFIRIVASEIEKQNVKTLHPNQPSTIAKTISQLGPVKYTPKTSSPVVIQPNKSHEK